MPKLMTLVVAAALVAEACAGGAAARGSPTPVADTGFVVTGDPASPVGAAWTYRGRFEGTDYDLSGVLMKPVGPGPFPAVILSHGYQGNAGSFASRIGPVMAGWGLVSIAPNYTHSSGVPIGKPGGVGEPGASEANVLRLHMTRELLRRLGYVDMSRVALHGHSMGAYLGVAAAGEYAQDFRVASQTGGGIRPGLIRSGPAPSPAQARSIRIPFQMHHGGADETVPLSFDQRFDELLSTMGVEHQLFIYPGKGHLEVRQDPIVLERIHAWYAAHGMF